MRHFIYIKSLYDQIIAEDTSKIKDISKGEVINNYYQLASLISSNGCNVLKKMAGHWIKCGFLDGEKLMCMDGLYQAVQNGTCLVYSFGLGDDWDFEIFMAELGMHSVVFYQKT